MTAGCIPVPADMTPQEAFLAAHNAELASTKNEIRRGRRWLKSAFMQLDDNGKLRWRANFIIERKRDVTRFYVDDFVWRVCWIHDRFRMRLVPRIIAPSHLPESN